MAALAILGTASAGSAATLRVANNAVDFNECGRSGLLPCRSITQAITNASSGDTIIVGPGFYGDLDGNGTLGNSPGEEVPVGDTMLDVNKQLTIISRDGAGATVLDAAGIIDNAVLIEAAGVVFGKPNHGFTVKNAIDAGLVIAAASVTARGNVAAFNSTGISVSSISGAGVVLSGNATVGNSDYGIDGNIDMTIKGNILQSNAEGMSVTGGSVTKNVAVGNDLGVAILPVGTLAAFNHNAVVANHLGGVEVSSSSTVGVGLDHNDYFGNGDRGTPAHCGLLLNAPSGVSLSVFSASDFWGTFNAPDQVCTSGTGTMTVTVTTPAAKEIVVKPPSIR